MSGVRCIGWLKVRRQRVTALKAAPRPSCLTCARGIVIQRLAWRQLDCQAWGHLCGRIDAERKGANARRREGQEAKPQVFATLETVNKQWDARAGSVPPFPDSVEDSARPLKHRLLVHVVMTAPLAPQRLMRVRAEGMQLAALRPHHQSNAEAHLRGEGQVRRGGAAGRVLLTFQQGTTSSSVPWQIATRHLARSM